MTEEVRDRKGLMVLPDGSSFYIEIVDSKMKVGRTPHMVWRRTLKNRMRVI